MLHMRAQFVRTDADRRYDCFVARHHIDATDQRILDLLEETGVIRRYTAELDHGALGGYLEAFTELRFAPGTQVDEIDGAVRELPELVESFTLAGEPDALIRLRVADVDHLKRV